MATAASVSPSDFSSSPAMRNRSFFRAAAVGPARLQLQRLDQVGDVVGLGVERLQRRRGRRGGREVVLIEVEDQLPGVDGRPPVVETPGVELRGTRQQIGAAADVGGVAPERQLLIDVDQLGEPLQRRGETFDLRERVGVERVGGQHLAPGGERDGPRLQLVLLQVGHARQQRRRLRPLQNLALDLEDRGQARPGAALLVDRRQDLRDALALGGDRQQLLEQPAGAFVVGRRLDDPFQQIERAGDVVEPSGAQVGAPELQLRHLGLRGEADARPEQRLEIGPALTGGVEPLERAVGAQVGRIELQHLLVRLERVVRIGERRLVQLGDLRQQIQPLARVERRQLAGVEERPQLRPTLPLLVEARQRAEGAGVHRLGGEDLRVDLLRLRRPSRLLLLELGDDHQEVAPQVAIFRRAGRRAQLVAELSRDAGAGGEPEQRLAVRHLRGIDLEQRQAGPVGLGRIVERPAVERPQPLQPVDPLAQRVGDGEQHLVRVGQLGGVLGPLVERQRHARDRRALRMTGCRQPLEPGDGRRRIGVGLRHLAVRGERRVDVLEPRLLQVPDAQEQLLALLEVFLRGVRRRRAAAGEIAAQRLDDAVPVLPRLGDAHQRAAGPLVGRLDVEDRRPGGRRGGQIGHALLFDLRDAQQQLDPLGGVGRAIGAGVEQLGQLGPGLRLGENGLERAVGLLVVADLRQDLLGGAAGVLGLEEPRGGDAQHPAQQPDPLLGVGRDGKARLVEGRQRAPLVRFAGQPLEVGADVRVLGRRLERARAPLEGQRLRAEPLLGDPARLGEELEPLGHPHAVARRRRAEQHLVGRQEPRPLLRRPVERHQRQRRLAVARVGRQDPLVGLERALGLIELLLRERRDPLEQARARRHVGRSIGQRGQLIAELAEGALLGVQRLERGVVARLRVDLAQRAGGAGVLGIERLDPLEDIDGGLGGGHPLVEQRPAPFEQRQLRLGVSLGVLPLPLEDLHQRRPASLALVQRRQASRAPPRRAPRSPAPGCKGRSPRACR